MPTFRWKSVRIHIRTDFLSELSRLSALPDAPPEFHNDEHSFLLWSNADEGQEVPDGAWWVDCQSFKVEGDGSGTEKLRPFSYDSDTPDSEFLGILVEGGALVTSGDEDGGTETLGALAGLDDPVIVEPPTED